MRFLDGVAIRAITSELRTALLGGKATRKIVLVDDSSFILHIRPGGVLFLSIDPSMPRIYLLKELPESRFDISGGFCAILRRYLEGGRIIGVEQEGLDRVVKISAESGPGTGLKTIVKLVVEIMGKHSNAILVEEKENKILGAMKVVTADMSGYRQVLPGLPYIPPPPQKKLDPMKLSKDEFIRIASRGAKRITDGITGIGRPLAERIYMILERDGEDITWRWFEDVRMRILEERFDPVVILSPSGDPTAAFPFPVPLEDGERMEEVESMSDAIRALSEISLERELLTKERRRISSILESSLERMRNALAGIERDMERVGDPELYRIKGQAILSNLGSIGKVERHLRLRDLWDPQMPEIDVDLDPSLPLQDNANLYFQKYKKAKESLEAMRRRKERILEEIRYLEELISILGVASSSEELSALWEEMVELGITRSSGKKVKVVSGPRRYVSPDGWEIVVGRNGIQNERILSEASPHDIWMHARGIPGSHVVLKLPFKPKDLHSIPRDALELAAKAAAYFSSGRGSRKVEVDIAFRKHVRKVKGAKPGFVTYSNEKTIVVYPDPEVAKSFEGGG